MIKKLYLTGEIDVNAYRRLSKAIHKAYDEDFSEVDLVIMSEGGDAYAALAIHDLINSYDGILPVNTTGIGLVASAATLILASGVKRTLHKNAWVMIHEDTPPVTGEEKVTDLELAVLHARRMEDQWNKLLAERTKLSAEEWAGINSVESYLTPSECLAYGLIDEVV